MSDTVLIARIAVVIDRFAKTVKERVPAWENARDPVAFRQMETEVAATARAAADEICGEVLQSIAEDLEFRAETERAARRAGAYRGGEVRPVRVTLLSGREVVLRIPYLKPDRRGRVGRPRGVGRRGRGGSGMYPVLAALGIWFGVTPALAAEVCCQVADSDSLRAGRDALARRGSDLALKRVHRIVNSCSRRCVAQRQQWMQDALACDAPISDSFAGKRVVIAPDGGRLRERRPKKRGRRRKTTGRRGYGAPWREPKLFVIYTIDENGEPTNCMRPVYDGTLGDCNAMFALLASYLKALDLANAREVIVVGDGAKWIWERAASILRQVGVPAERITEVIDWYHAVETIHEIAAIPAGWSAAAREKWTNRARRLLAGGHVNAVVAMIDDMAAGRRAKDVNSHRDYFVRNTHRMQYSSFKKAKVPRGSGAVESMVRRVVNMRMKANGTFWLEENAEGMLMLRSYLKAARFDDLMDWSFRTAASWWETRPRATLNDLPEAA